MTKRLPYPIRPSRPDDADAIVAIWRRAVDATHLFLSTEDRAAIDPDPQAYLRSTPLWVAVDGDNRPAGFMGLSEGRLDSLFIDPAHHGRGAGRALIEQATALHPTLDTEVNTQNPGAASFYRRMGFVETGYAATDNKGRPYPLLRLRLDRRDGIHLRFARAADLALLPGIEQSAAGAFRSTLHAWVTEDDVTPVEAYLPMLAEDRLWVIEADRELAGFVSAAVVDDAMHVLELAVHADHQRRGYGRRLVQATIQAADTRRLGAVTLTTFQDVAFNAPFYRSLGFGEISGPNRRLQAILDAEARHGLTARCAMRLEVER